MTNQTQFYGMFIGAGIAAFSAMLFMYFSISGHHKEKYVAGTGFIAMIVGAVIGYMVGYYMNSSENFQYNRKKIDDEKKKKKANR